MPQDWREVAYRRRTGVSIAGMKRSYNGRYNGGSYKRARFARRGGRALAHGRFSGYYRRSGFYGRFAGAGATANSGPELKFIDSSIDDAVIASGGVIFPGVNLIAQGVGPSERIGRKCVLKSVMWRGDLSLPEMDAQVTPNNGEIIRLMVLIDKQANGAVTTPTTILANATIEDYMNLVNKDRFQVLYDKRHTLNYAGLASDGAGVVSSGQVLRWFKMSKKLNLPIEFSGATGAVTEIRSNNLVFCAFTIGTLAGIASRVRVRFSDS